MQCREEWESKSLTQPQQRFEAIQGLAPNTALHKPDSTDEITSRPSHRPSSARAGTPQRDQQAAAIPAGPRSDT